MSNVTLNDIPWTARIVGRPRNGYLIRDPRRAYGQVYRYLCADGLTGSAATIDVLLDNTTVVPRTMSYRLAERFPADT